MKRFTISVIFGLIFPSTAQASVMEYTFDFQTTSGPFGLGGFSFTECPDVFPCPELTFETSFDGLVFDTVQLGGNAEFLLSFFTGTLSPTPQGQ